MFVKTKGHFQQNITQFLTNYTFSTALGQTIGNFKKVNVDKISL